MQPTRRGNVDVRCSVAKIFYISLLSTRRWYFDESCHPCRGFHLIFDIYTPAKDESPRLLWAGLTL
jgi:hypothetical protein